MKTEALKQSRLTEFSVMNCVWLNTINVSIVVIYEQLYFE